MNFLVDMNLSASWTDFLTGAGHTAVDWSDEGPPDAPDRALLTWAADRDYVILTADLDPAALPAAAKRPGVMILACGDLTPDALGYAVLEAIHEAGAELAKGAVVAVAGEPAPLRILPLRGR